jgi:hypothetical protein
MAAHLELSATPVPALRTTDLGATGLQRRRARPRTDFRAELRALLSPTAGRHRVTFVPLDKYHLQVD